MICAPCRNAGDTLAAGRGKVTEGLSRVLAAIWHAECEDCDCQHKLNNPHHA